MSQIKKGKKMQAASIDIRLFEYYFFNSFKKMWMKMFISAAHKTAAILIM